MMSTAPPAAPRAMRSRSNSASQAVIEVSGREAASAKPSVFGLRADEALVHQLELRVAAGPIDGASVEHLLARAEDMRVRPARHDHARGVEAQHARLAGGVGAGSLLGVHRIHRDGADLDEQVMAPRLGGVAEDQILQRVLMGHGMAMGIGDGLHV